MNTERIKVWDLPVRVFHWLLFLLIVGATVTGKVGGGAIEWHGRIGLAIIGLLVFRIVWGFIGSSHARFSSFVPRPSSLNAYLRGDWKGVGHNPLGALSVLALLALIGVQAATGIFGNDEIAFSDVLAEAILLAVDRLELAAEALVANKPLAHLSLPVMVDGLEAMATAEAEAIDGEAAEMIVAVTGFRPSSAASGTWHGRGAARGRGKE